MPETSAENPVLNFRHPDKVYLQQHGVMFEDLYPAAKFDLLDLTDFDTSRIQAVPGIRAIEFNRCLLGTDGLQFLKGLPTLSELAISNVNLGSPDLAVIAELESLTSLWLIDNEGMDRLEIAELECLNGLETFAFAGREITKNEMSVLSEEAVRLESLLLSGVEVDAEKCRAIAGMKSLRHLFLTDCSINERGVSVIASHGLIRILHLDGSTVTDDAIAHLPKLPLKELSLQRTPISDAALAALQKLNQLEKLDLKGTSITLAGGLQLLEYYRKRSSDNPKTYKPVSAFPTGW